MTQNLQINDVVQIDVEHDEIFGGCFMIVTEPKSWGAQGYVKNAAQRAPDGSPYLAFYRCKHEQMTLIGRAEWSIIDNRTEEVI